MREERRGELAEELAEELEVQEEPHDEPEEEHHLGYERTRRRAVGPAHAHDLCRASETDHDEELDVPATSFSAGAKTVRSRPLRAPRREEGTGRA